MLHRYRLSMLALTLASLLILTAGCGPTLSPNVTLTKDFIYGRGLVDPDQNKEYTWMDLPMDILEPNDIPAENRPALVIIHGGSFDHGERSDEELMTLADAIASKGYVCFLIDYRLLGDYPPEPDYWTPVIPPIFLFTDFASLKAPMHAAFVDAKSALRHVHAKSSAYGVDPERIAVLGESAGAFAAIAAGVTEPEAFASDGPDHPTPAENNPEANPIPKAVIDCWGNGDLFLEDFDANDPPFMVFHGTNDFEVGVSLAPAINIRDACEAAGIPCRYYPLLGEDHGAWEATYDGKNLPTLVVEFLDTYLKK